MTIYTSRKEALEFEKFLNSEQIQLIQKPVLNLDTSSVLEYLTVGGGITAIAKCILQYLQLHYQKRKVTIKLKDTLEIDVEASSIKELEKLLEAADTITITKLQNESKNDL
ncbi:hypothetical protein EXU85_30155 [Spirosoma sp. KCTC 42546]|uniref:hypothetical protein n=1 Tax=Spirosoma sp. KCTC 42546 TaxID=2520506 RepID=UPI0011573483|nr:hypothetical protein [Spirosoma sp. KCTC 42546]QDK82643.1 hypothetical protein EXU85_30155 [Spirosoma sp. KCTC 42546]